MRLALLGAAFACAAVVGSHAGAGSAAAPCAATTVRYQPAKHLLGESPWVLAQPAAIGVAAFLVSYPEMLADGRVNRRDGLVLWQLRSRMVWHHAGERGPNDLAARRLDGPGFFRTRLVAGAVVMRFPAPGCWRLTVDGASVVGRVVPTLRRQRCEPTPLAEGGRAVARPRSNGLSGSWSWRTANGGALLYTHGKGPGDVNMKVPWWIRRHNGSDTIDVTGTRVDAPGSFRQSFGRAPSYTGPDLGDVYPSIVDVPAAGCWLLRVRSGRVAGALVVRVVDR